MTKPLDPRRYPYRPEIAADFLRSVVEAQQYSPGVAHTVVAGSAAIRGEPGSAAQATSEALFGETFTVFDQRPGWSWGQLTTDGYVGWVETNALAAGATAASHRVRVPRTLRFPEAELKAPPVMALSLNSCVTVVTEAVTRGLRFAVLTDGTAVPADHLVPIGMFREDFPATALEFLHVPYLWGGRSSLGLDCSGLVQMAMADCGMPAPRDSDMQQEELGDPLPLTSDGADVARGDLLFWPGHVAIGLGDGEMVHANGHHMMVVREPIGPALDRMATAGSHLSGCRRIGSD